MYVSMYVCMYVLGTWDLSVFMKKSCLYRACHFYYWKTAQYFSTINDEWNIHWVKEQAWLLQQIIECVLQRGSQGFSVIAKMYNIKHLKGKVRTKKVQLKQRSSLAVCININIAIITMSSHAQWSSTSFKIQSYSDMHHVYVLFSNILIQCIFIHVVLSSYYYTI